ncbi:glycosyltransferase family 2 protein [Mangrovibacter phragmitis]|uniref:glycosyltransferase family 2 protein n=1 Tax=Mangrovibacter phragmitis TaxID=1691903 RepID=UPI00336AE96B
MSKEGKILSLTIPTYNRAGYLKRLLDSISRQAIEVSSYLEIIIIDNASTDNTVEVVNDFINKVPFAKFIKNDSNLGMDGNFKNALNLHLLNISGC